MSDTAVTSSRAKAQAALADEPSVCVVMPAYRCAETIGAALRSILEQDYPNLMVGVGIPADDTETLTAAQAVDSPRIQIVRQAGRGIADARNQVLQGVQADLYMFLDADDRMLPGVVSSFVTARLASPDAGLRYGHYLQEPPQGAGKRLMRRAPFLGRVPSAFERLCLLNFLATGAIMIDREVVEKVGLFSTEYRHAEDWHYWTRISRAYPVFGLDIVCYSYSYGKLSLSRPYPREFFVDAQKAARDLGPRAPILAISLSALRGMYALYYFRTFNRRRTAAALMDIKLMDVVSLIPAAGVLFVRKLSWF